MQKTQYIDIKEASVWASQYLGKNVTPANISYLINYGCIVPHKSDNGRTYVSVAELEEYYKSNNTNRAADWQQKLGDDLNWELSFDYLKEAQTTKHVHRLHPYKGKFIPQLVEYFIDDHTDKFKTERYFSKGDIILDPFCGSGTTLVQANELGIDAVGVDISQFNALISNCKVARYDIDKLNSEIEKITLALKRFIDDNKIGALEKELLDELNIFNNIYFPVPDYKYQVRHKLVDGKKYGEEKSALFLPIYENLLAKYEVSLRQDNDGSFAGTWFTRQIRSEIEFVSERIRSIEDNSLKNILRVILSRTMRSCRATPHADLGTLKEPVMKTYYCSKHGKICKPLFSILKWWQTYSKDTVGRLKTFDALRTDSRQYCLAGDSRSIDVAAGIEEYDSTFADKIRTRKIKGIFTSPPYVGLIDYHEQHAYAYDIFGFERNDESEIGALYKGQGLAAQKSYIQGIADVLKNCKTLLADDYDIFIVANDKYGLYPHIAELSGMKIVNRYKRPVLNRTEKDKAAYSEIIFQLKAQNR